jgi:hypothetical protein
MFGNVNPGFMGKSSTNHGGFYLAHMEGYWAIHNFFVPHIG